MGVRVLFLSLTLMLAACKAQGGQDIPGWVEERLAAMRAQPAGEAVREYDYQGRKAYYFLAPCCDQMNELFDAQGVKICAPDGGFTGRGDGKCPDFRGEARLLRTLWEDPANHPAHSQ